MSAAKHTQGEWSIKSWTEYDKDGAMESCGDQVVARLPNGNEVGIFTTALEGEPLADLRLIAAAPCLLALVKRLALLTDEGDDQIKGAAYIDRVGVIRAKGSLLETIEQARAAIRKATGEGA